MWSMRKMRIRDRDNLGTDLFSVLTLLSGFRSHLRSDIINWERGYTLNTHNN